MRNRMKSFQTPTTSIIITIIIVLMPIFISYLIILYQSLRQGPVVVLKPFIEIEILDVFRLSFL